MKRVFRSYAWSLPLLLVLGCTKKDEPIPLPPEPSSPSGAEDVLDAAARETGTAATATATTGTVPGTVATAKTPLDAGKGAEAGASDAGPTTGIPPFPKPPAGFPTGFPIPSGLPAIPTGLPSAFPFPTPKSS